MAARVLLLLAWGLVASDGVQRGGRRGEIPKVGRVVRGGLFLSDKEVAELVSKKSAKEVQSLLEGGGPEQAVGGATSASAVPMRLASAVGLPRLAQVGAQAARLGMLA